MTNEDSEDTIDGKNDGQSASGNIITDTTADDASNTELTLSITEVKFGNEPNVQTYTLPTDGTNLEITSDYGTLTINNTGAYTYDVNETATDSLNVGDNPVESFTYTLTDGYNTDTADLKITVEGRDDAPEITSITANDRATHTIDGVVDLDGDGAIDTITPDDLLNNNGSPTFTSDNGNFILEVGNENSSMSVEYHGGNASHQNIVGFYEKADDGTFTDVKIIYADDVSGFDSTYANLGTLNDLNDEVGFFIIPNGYNNDDIKSIIDSGDYDVSIGSDNKVTLSTDTTSTTANTVYYTDNTMSTDGKDHAIVAKNDDGTLTIGFEDLSMGDQDYDDVVLTINPCLELTDGREYFVDLGKVSENDEQYSWVGDTNSNASWSNTDSNGNTVTITALDFDGSADTLKYDGNYQLGVEGARSSDVSGVSNQLQYDEKTDQSQAIVMEFEGNLNHAEFSFSRLIAGEGDGEQGYWTAYKEDTVVGEGVLNGGNSDNPTFTIDTGNEVFDKIVFTAIQYEVADTTSDSSDYYIQSFQGSGPDWANGNDAIINNIDLSDVDDVNLESATIVLTNYKDGDTIGTIGSSLPGGLTMTQSVIDGEWVVVLTGTATKAMYEHAIESLTFDTTSTDRDVRTFEYTVFDGDKHSNTMPVSLDIGGCEINSIHTPEVHVQISQNDITMEGNVLSHTVSLVYADGTPFVVPDGETITVNLAYSDISGVDAVESGDFDNLTTQVTITGGNSSITFENDTAYNSENEEDEGYTVKIASIADSATDTNGEDSLLKETTFVIDDTSATGEIVDIDQEGKEDDKNTKEGVNEGGDWDINLVSGDLTKVYTEDKVQSITISGIPDDATIKDASGTTVTFTASGTLTVTSLEIAEALTITPALDSSTDIKLSYEVALTDGSTENFSQTITINPEVDQPWTLGELGHEEKTYDAILEDSGFKTLGLTNTDASTGASGDANETVTYVRFSGVDIANNNAIHDGTIDYFIPDGSVIRYQKDNGDYVEYTFSSSDQYFTVPADKLDTVEFKAAENFNGEVKIRIEAKAIDKDDDQDDDTTDKLWSDDYDHNNDGTETYYNDKTDWGVSDKLIIKVTGGCFR